ncbi:hypothetical protein NFI96_023534 [Prochilodus magdalenae]|nr:hypothetical protein NFI96_023534 [Prochilodus magdalenae]
MLFCQMLYEECASPYKRYSFCSQGVYVFSLPFISSTAPRVHLQIKFQRDIESCCVLALTETWLSAATPSTGITPAGFSIYHQDRMLDSGKGRGGGVCVMVNSRWGSDVAVLASHCSPDIELITVKVRPYFPPGDFSSVILTTVYTRPPLSSLQSTPDLRHPHYSLHPTSAILTTVYIPPQADESLALKTLYETISRPENSHPEAVFIVVGDFNRANLKMVLPKYYQHINFPARGEQMREVWSGMKTITGYMRGQTVPQTVM